MSPNAKLRAKALAALEAALEEHSEPEPATEGDAANLARLVEERDAQLENVRGDLRVALARLDKLERILTREGGHMSPGDQAELRDARAVLEHHGLREVKRTEWRDR